ncbi:I78 family peptidase inhibitor [Novosphingobium sp. SL115]|uniref:I78 family peptidase inhibitor n=1 Tax=Novosphingobium sp. SL115 TaxID=2995150 RepID=UPI0022735E32|nr:I78 family peptidase inhibitor [Novosphingobium sp. SL115]MCY1671056.1 I78 family peptidase inhibitor [Novosphingobium sp. SL115]
MKLLPLASITASLALAACSTQAPPVAEVPVMPEGNCNADPARGLAGEKASAATGAELLRLTGAHTLRWVPPRSAVTMDYRADRLTVGYDDDYTINRISCG